MSRELAAAQAEIMRLRDRVEDLIEEVRQRDAAYGRPGLFPYELDLMHAEDLALSALFNAYPGGCHIETLMLRIWGPGSDVVSDAAASLIRRVRAKLEPHGIEIVIAAANSGTYRLTEAGFAALSTLREQATKRGQPGGLRAGKEPFTPHEDAALTVAWNRGDFVETIIADLRKMGFPLRSFGSIIGRSKRLKLPLRTPPRWTEEADEIVRVGYKTKAKWSTIVARLRKIGQKRTIHAIRKRVEDLDLPPNRCQPMQPRELEIMNDGIGRGLLDSEVVRLLAKEGYVRSITTIARRRRDRNGLKRKLPDRRKIAALRARKPAGAEIRVE